MSQPRVLFCNCAHAQVVPPEVKRTVLQKLCESGLAFDAVPDLCEMSARRDPALHNFASDGPVKIAACFPRAVKWLFASAGAPLSFDSAEILNMRVQPAEEVSQAIFNLELRPNVPRGKVTASDAPDPPATAVANAPASN
jgi:hypothetical protein